MKRFINFLRRERLYVLILIFVIVMTAVILYAPSEKAKSPSGVNAVKTEEVKAAQKTALAEREAVEKILAENKDLALIFALVSLLVITLFLLGIAIDAMFIINGFTGSKIRIASYKPQKVRWGILDVFKLIILLAFFDYMLMLIEAFLVRTFPIIKDGNFRMIFNSSIMDGLCIVLVLYFTVVQYKEQLAALGLSLKNFFKNVYYGIVAYIALIPVLIIIIAVISLVISLTKYVPQKQPVVDLLLKEKSSSFLLYMSLFAAIGGPIIEELFFRGFLYNAVKKYTGIFWATFITAAIFAALHTHLVGFLPIFALGILLAYLYEKTGTLVSSMAVHMVHNVGMVLLVFLVKRLGTY